MRKSIALFILLIVLGIVSIPFSVFAEDDPEVISASSEAGWGSDLDNIMITVKTNKDVDQIILKSGQGEFILSPETNYGEEDLRGNNEAMDMNGDLEVDQLDLEILKKHVDGMEPGNEKEGCKLFTATVRCSHCGAADIDGDGKIDASDLAMLESHLDGKCTLDDCYFHGKRTYREETEDEYIWSVHYTPTIAGTDIMTITPQSITSTGTRNGEPSTLEIKAEEFKDPKIIRAWLVPNQNKYLINTVIDAHVVTPLECDAISVGSMWHFDERDKIEGDPASEYTSYIKTEINFETKEKTWVVPVTYGERLTMAYGIIGAGIKSDGSLLTHEDDPTYLYGALLPVRWIKPEVITCTTSITDSWVERWTTDSPPDAEGNVVTTQHTRNWYTHTVTAVCHNNTDYVIFQTPEGTVTDTTYKATPDNTNTFSTSWTNNSSSGEGSAEAFATIITKPPLFDE